MRALIILLTFTLLAGCATSPQVQAKRATFQKTIPTCTKDIDCEVKWEAAQVWIVRNAGFKLQVATDTLLETYNPTDYSVNLGVRVIKEPLGGGNYRIVVSTYCANIFGCQPDTWDAALDFNRTINAVTP